MKGQCQGHSDIKGLYRKAAGLGHMLLLNRLNTNRKLYMGSPKPPSHLTLSDLESQS